MHSFKSILLLIALAVLSVGGVSALADDMSSSRASENQSKVDKVPDGLKERVLAYWQAKIEGRSETAYGFVSPEARKVLTYKHFLSQMKGVGRWQSARFRDAKCNGDSCAATIIVEIKMRLPRFPEEIHTTAPVTEKWYRKDGQWWILLDA